MTAPREPDYELEDRIARRLLDVFIRAGLVLALVLLCYQIFSPFMTMMLWALILAITIYPLHQMLAARIGGKQGLASTLIVLLAVAVIITPTVMLGSQFADSVHDLVNGVRDNTLQMPAPSDRVAAGRSSARGCMRSGRRRTTTCRQLVKSMQPKLGELASKALGIVAGVGRQPADVHLFVHRRRHHDGLGRSGREGDAGDLRTHLRPGARPGVRQVVHRDGARRRCGRHRHRLHPGADHRRRADDRRRPVRRRAGGGRPRARHRAVAGAAGHAAGDRLDLGERRLRQPSRPSPTACCCSSAAWPTTC